MSSKYVASAFAAIPLAAPFLMPSLFPLAWVAFVPLFWAIDRSATLKQAAFCGWLMGLCAHLIGFHWLVYTISVFGGFPYGVSVIVFFVYASLQALQMALFAALVRGAGLGSLAVWPAVFWVPLEFLFPLLFPWHVANSQSAFSWFVQSADVVGPYGASFIIIWFNAAVYRALASSAHERKLSLLPLGYAALGLIVSVVYGVQRLGSIGEEIAAARKLPVAAVQGNVDIDLKWDPGLAQKNLDKHRTLTAGHAGPVAVVIWPESAIEQWVPENLPQLPPDALPSFKWQETFFIFGAKSFRGKLGAPGMQAFNTAFFTDAQGKVLGRYHKQVLLAFGEYLPFSRVLSLLPMPFADGFTPGSSPLAFHLSQGVRIAPLICYEDLMPDLARRFVSETRANLLVNLTNDAWYGRSVGPWQHLWLAQSRAIETRRSLLRVTNTGVTSLVNAKGEIVETLPMFSDGVMQTEVDILNGETYYVRFGDWFAWSLTFVAAALLFVACRRRFQG